MASFKTHISFGVILGIAASALALSYALVAGQNSLLWVFAAVFFGSILPDLDSDESTPLKTLFLITSAAFSCLSVLYLFQRGVSDIKLLIGIPILSFLFVRYAVLHVFKKFTNHRGMFHSVPAMLIAAIGTFMVSGNFNLAEKDRIIMSCALGLGFLGHLFLDELKSTVGFHGLVYHPKKSLGTALKFFSRSKYANLVTYGLLAILGYANSNEIQKTYVIIKGLFKD
jgi:membrane-bound metal-dependent hydrolase YbcI (DUF457 family)